MKNAKLQFGAPEWLILIGGSIFIVVLLRLLHPHLP